MLEFYEGTRRVEDIRELCGRCVFLFSMIDLKRGIDELNEVAFETLLRENPFPRSLAV
jgi:orotate phosphoribosyltransferase-like protein